MAIVLKAGSPYASYRQAESVGFENFDTLVDLPTVEFDTNIDSNAVDENGLVVFSFGSSVKYVTRSDNVVTY
jgi:hypothetical protein